MMPGATALTRTPRHAHSSDSDLVRLSTAARAAPVCAMPGKPRHMSAMMFTTAPPFSSM